MPNLSNAIVCTCTCVGHIAFDIAFVTESKRAGRRRNTSKSGSPSAKLRNKMVGQNGCQTNILKQLEQTNGLTTCNVVKVTLYNFVLHV